MNYSYYLQEVVFSYNGQVVLNIPELKLPQATSLGIIGPNGSGKSTFLKILAFLFFPQEGEIYFFGKKEKNLLSLRRQVSLLEQTPYLLKRSVFDNIAYPLKIRKESNIETRVLEAMDLVALEPKKFRKRKWFELSGGEKQRVALASRIVFKPKVLLLDEPTTSLDQENTLLIRKALKELQNQEKMTIIVVSHDLNWLTTFTSQIYEFPLKFC